MNFVIPFLGKTKSEYLNQGIKDFTTRLSRFGTVELPVIKDKSGRNIAQEKVMELEAEQLLAAAKPFKKKICISLDPAGKNLSSEELALLLKKWQEEGINNGLFFIGGFAGLHSSVKSHSDLVISLSKMTFTHELTRLLLLEQLYRACTILAGHNYHK